MIEDEFSQDNLTSNKTQDEFNDQDPEFNGDLSAANDDPNYKPTNSTSSSSKGQLDTLTKAFLATITLVGGGTLVVTGQVNNVSSIDPSEISISFDQTDLDKNPSLPFSLPNFHDEKNLYSNMSLSLERNEDSGVYKVSSLFDITKTETMLIDCSHFLYDTSKEVDYILSGLYNGEQKDFKTGNLSLLPDIKHTLPNYIKLEAEYISNDFGECISMLSSNFYDDDSAYSKFDFVAYEIDESDMKTRQIGSDSSNSLDFQLEISSLSETACGISLDISAAYLNSSASIVSGLKINIGVL